MVDRREFICVAAFAALAPWPVLIRAESETATRIMVGFPAGGPVDIAARVFAPLLSNRLQEPFEVVNLPGASGNVATPRVATSKADGRTHLMAGPVNTISVTLFQNLLFDFAADFAPVAGPYSVPLIAEVHPSVPARSVTDFIGLARERPGAVRVGYAGVGTPRHIDIEMFNVMTEVSLKLVPYAGSASALTDLLAGRLDVMFDPAPSSIDHVRAGRLRPLAVTGKAQLQLLPEIPIMSDFVPGYEAGSWFGLCAPRATPVTRIEAINAAISAALIDPEVAVRLNELGAQAMRGTSSDFEAMIGAEIRKYARIIARAGIPLRPAESVGAAAGHL